MLRGAADFAAAAACCWGGETTATPRRAHPRQGRGLPSLACCCLVVVSCWGEVEPSADSSGKSTDSSPAATAEPSGEAESRIDRVTAAICPPPFPVSLLALTTSTVLGNPRAAGHRVEKGWIALIMAEIRERERERDR